MAESNVGVSERGRAVRWGVGNVGGGMSRVGLWLGIGAGSDEVSGVGVIRRAE